MISRLFEIAARIRALFLSSRLDEELEEELDGHIELLIEDNLRRGMTSEEARREAIIKVGNRGSLRESNREARALRFAEDFVRDVHQASRLLLRNPLFVLLAVVSLAIGIGADTTVFTAANALLFRTPPGLTGPSRLVDISKTQRGQFGVFEISYPDFLDIRRRATLLDDVFLYEPMPRAMGMTSADGTETVFGNTVSPNYFDALGVTPAAGQLFPVHTDLESRNNPYAVLSYAYWQRRFKGDPSIIGKTFQVNGSNLNIAGVAAAGFQGTTIAAPEIWLPIGSSPMDAMRFTRRDVGWGLVGGHMKDGVTIAQAASEMAAIGAGLVSDFPAEHQDAALRLSKLSMIPANLVLAASGIFTVLLAFVSLVLLTACANLAGVLMSRAAARRQELAIRLAIGAGRARLVRQLLTETMMIFFLGAGAGLALSRALINIVLSQIHDNSVPVQLSIELDARIVLFTFGVSFLAALLCGLAPALQASKADVVSTLKSEGLTATHRSRLQNAFVIAQVAFSIVLVVAAGLFVGALQRVTSMPLGFDTHGIELARIDLTQLHEMNKTGPILLRELTERLRALSGVQQSTIAMLTPLETGRVVVELKSNANGAFAPPPRPPDSSVRVNWNSVEPGYFATMRIPLLSGRDFNISDRADSQVVAIVSQAAARKLWPGMDPLGRFLPANLGDSGNTAMVIGVVGDVKAIGGPQTTSSLIYRPMMQRFFPLVTIAVRATGGRHMAEEIHALLFSMNPNILVLNSQTLDDAVAEATSPQRNAAMVTGSLGVIGLLLASIGVYGVTAYAVTRRTREIGIRTALGARRGDVTKLVLREGMSLVAAGALIGLILAFAASRLLPATPLDVPAANFSAFAGAAALFGVVGLLACWMPVRRATRIDAMFALRHD